MIDEMMSIYSSHLGLLHWPLNMSVGGRRYPVTSKESGYIGIRRSILSDKRSPFVAHCYGQMVEGQHST